jgi:uncharacterized membrane protein
MIKLSFDVSKPLSEVWEFGLDSNRIPDWQFDISSVKSANAAIQGVGDAYTLVYHMWRRDFDRPVQITRFEPPHIMETSGRTPIGGLFRSTTQMQATASGTHVDWQMDYQLPFGLIGKALDLLIFRKAFENTVRKYNDNFKALAEGRHAPHQTIRGKDKSKHPA